MSSVIAGALWEAGAMRRGGIVIASVAAVCGLALATVALISLNGPMSPPGGRGDVFGGVIERGDVYRYAVYAPSSVGWRSPAPLVVVLHGCEETAAEVAAASGFDQVARRRGFIVLYPDGDAVDEVNGGCWKGIWEPGAEGRDRGDAGAIAEMTRAVASRWHIDAGRIYVIGISAGGYETAILGADYPDLYAAIGIHSGAAYDDAALGCASVGGRHVNATTDALARAALVAMAGRARVMPVIVIHGDRDGRVPYGCGREALSQWLLTDDLVLEREHHPLLPTTPTRVSHAVVTGGHPYTVASYADSSGCVIAQFWSVHGMGHFWSGGSSDPSWSTYSDPRGPSAAGASWAFFSHWSLSGAAGPCTAAVS
jgi:poly(hydroxyalkanoate) depolymerase family esterase